jgi:hypothetical protein
VYDCTIRGLQRPVHHGLDNLVDQIEGFSDFEQGLDWMFRMAGYEDNRNIAEGLTQAW